MNTILRGVFVLGVPAVLLVSLAPAAPRGESPAAMSSPAPDGTDPAWLSQASRAVEAREYEVSQTRRGLQAPNRAQNLRTWFRPEGVELEPRVHAEEAPPWRVRWETAEVGRTGCLEPLGSVAPSFDGPRVEYRRDTLLERYENRRDGLEQVFEMDSPPPGDGGRLEIRGRVSGAARAETRDQGRTVDFLDGNGVVLLRSEGLFAQDSAGRELEASFEVEGTEVAIRIEDAGARYPILVDPLLGSPSWTTEGNQADARFGGRVASAGDVNGDGFSDVIVGATLYDAGQTNEGAAFLFLGSASGLSTSPAWTGEGNQADAHFGFCVASAGDVNGDGYSDVIVGADAYDGGQTDEGAAYLFLGSASGLATSASWTGEGNQAGASYGASAASAGDVNGDGYGDVIVGAQGYDNGQVDEGGAYLYLGSASGLSTSPSWSGEGNQFDAQFGTAVSGAGDVNADGYADVIVGVPQYDNGQTNEGVGFLYVGSSLGLGTLPAWTGESNQSDSLYGVSVAGAGDVNGDGYSDVIVGANSYDAPENNEGAAFAYLGSASGLSTSPSWTGEGNQDSSFFGGAVSSAGDVNGDGYGDVIVGAGGDSGGVTNGGAARVYQGSASGLATASSWVGYGAQSNASFANSVSSAGDVNGDGYSDVIVGASRHDAGQTDEGAAFVYLGTASGPATSPAWTAEGNQSGALLGWSVASAGDVNGDGYSDVIVGAIHYPGDQPPEGAAFVFLGSGSGPATTPSWTAEGNQVHPDFGVSVASAGDVNGDGYSDVIVGAYSYDAGQTNEGAAFVYLGSASGLSTSPAWTAEGNQDATQFGWSLAGAGDVNGDGYSDVIVGAYSYDAGQTNEGAAFVYLGSASGLTASPAWTGEENQVEAQYGRSVAGAGDVNGDGYSDVIVGAPGYDAGQSSEGAAFVYLGSASGLPTAASWTVEGNQDSASFGFSVAGGTDVNGDGYSDVIVGAAGYDAGDSNEGAAFVYLGSASGLSTAAAWTGEGNQTDASFGFSVAAAGDVNGDGYSDVIVGANGYDAGDSNEGAAFVYLGSASGLSSSPAWTGEENQANANFGFSVAAAGDVNGDGYSDVIVGAESYDAGQLNEGAAFLFFGNGGLGKERLPRQFRTDGLTPIALGGKSDATDSFALRTLCRAPAGRGKVRLQYEVKPLGTPFNGTGLASGPVLDTGAPGASGSAVSSSAQPTGLSPATYVHWRARTVTNSISSPRSPWFSIPSDGITESKLRTKGSPISGATIDVNPAAEVCGGPVSFGISISGGPTPPLLYQWRKNGVPIPGATASTFTIASATPADEGAYDCVVSNWEGPVTSNAIPLYVNVSAPAFTLQPTSVQVCPPGSASFTVAVTGSVPQFQWRRNLVPIAGATSPTLTINPVTSGAFGAYDCVATNACGSTASQMALLQPSLFSLAFSQPLGPGSLRIQNTGAPPGHVYFFAVSFNPLNATAPGLGWWQGLWITVPELGLWASFGIPPFLGFFGGTGSTDFVFPGGSVSGLAGMTLYGVTTTFDPGSGLSQSCASNVASLVIL